jgi:oligoribonuclease NrnB/cAMP/cGMP phosphodiesterase (DHH superfamily)
MKRRPVTPKTLSAQTADRSGPQSVSADKKQRKAGRPTDRSAIIVTHGPFCLDGIASAVCVGRFYGEARTTPLFTHPSEVDRVIEEATRNSNDPHDLWIADITWKQPKTEKLFKELIRQGWRIFWVDHHSIAVEKDEKEIKALGLTGWVASRRFSAARLLYDYLISTEDLLGKAPADLKRFEAVVLLADDNDRWLHQRRGSRELALTVAALGGTAAYRELLHAGPDLRYSPRMEEAYRRASRELAASIALANRTRMEKVLENGVKIVTVICNGYTSEVADTLRRTVSPDGTTDEPAAIFLLYNLEDQRISLRKTPACQIDLARLAGQFGGGGHPAAAGFDLPEAREYLQGYLVDRLKQALKK